jgi:FKBP-type peptidyl-prolyl cis-trans isomerase
MSFGDKAILYIPSHLAYGAGAGNVILMLISFLK